MSRPPSASGTSAEGFLPLSGSVLVTFLVSEREQIHQSSLAVPLGIGMLTELFVKIGSYLRGYLQPDWFGINVEDHILLTDGRHSAPFLSSISPSTRVPSYHA